MPKTQVRSFLMMAAALTSSIACVLATLATVLLYRHYYGYNCGAATEAAFDYLFFIPLLLAVPLMLWVGKNNGFFSRRAAARMTLWPAIFWAVVCALILLMEKARVFLR